MTPIARSITLILASVMFSSVGQAMLKLGLTASHAGEHRSVIRFIRSAAGSWQVWLGLVLFVASVLVWMRVLATSELSWSYPLLGLSYVSVALIGRFVFHEPLSASRLAGIALVLAGAGLIARS